MELVLVGALSLAVLGGEICTVIKKEMKHKQVMLKYQENPYMED